MVAPGAAHAGAPVRRIEPLFTPGEVPSEHFRGFEAPEVADLREDGGARRLKAAVTARADRYSARSACPAEVWPYAVDVGRDTLWANLPEDVLQTCYTASFYFFEMATEEIVRRTDYRHFPVPGWGTVGWQQRFDDSAILGIPDASADQLIQYLAPYSMQPMVAGVQHENVAVRRCVNFISQLVSVHFADDYAARAEVRGTAGPHTDADMLPVLKNHALEVVYYQAGVALHWVLTHQPPTAVGVQKVPVLAAAVRWEQNTAHTFPNTIG